MNNSHTPGPWECFHAKNEHGEETMGIRGGTCFIATMDTTAIGDGPYRMPESGEANARLIAAAPELLDAAELTLARHDGPCAMSEDDWDELRAAITKAKEPQ